MNQEILAPGMVFQSRYEVLSTLREGGLVFAYQGRQIATGQPIVLKVVRLDRDGAPANLARIRGARFLRQMRFFARLQHPGIVRPLDAGQTDEGQLYAVFELVPGQSLSELLAEQGALEPQQARHLMRQVLDALACAHRHGMVHGDLQPSHVMALQAGALRDAKVLDFGFGALAAAARASRGETLAASSELVTWRAYAAPEQLRGYPPTARSDLYAWGLVFLECLTGRHAGRGRSPEGGALQPDRGEPVRVPGALLEHPLGAILRKTTVEDVAARDVTADGLLCELDACEVSDLRREDLIPNDAPSGAEASGAEGRREDIAGPALTAPKRDVTTPPDDLSLPGISGEEPALTLSERARAAVPLRTGIARSPAEPVMDRVPVSAGDVIKHYEIIRKLGQGGMGVVYLARDTTLGRLVAIKFLLSYTGRRVERFLDEARATARCRHENIVVIHEIDEIHGCPYLVLEYIKGRSLREWMTQRGLPGAPASSSAPTPPGSRATGVVVEAMIPVVRALVCAHELGIVHRDLKPENILVDDAGCTKVLDFGLAKRIEAKRAPALTGAAAPTGDAGEHRKRGAIGTPGYMAPEQLLGSDVDGRADLWAVGVILVELLTGEHPLEPLSPARLPEIVNLEIPMPSLSERYPEVGALGDLVDRCLKKRKADRIGTARELLAELEALVPGRRRALDPSEGESPFAGLFAFQEADAARFFGRERDATAMAARLRSQQLMAIAGPSGAGKSSFVRAGVLPALKRAEDGWESFILRPGRQPLSALADVLMQVAAEVESAGMAACSPELRGHDRLVATLRTQPGYLGAQLRARCRRDGPRHRALLFVDQFEELYTLGTAPEERAAFVACLEGVADDASSPLRVLLAIRSDFLDRLAEHRDFMTGVTRGLWFLPPMGRDDLREALTRPLEAARYRFETADMVEHMLGTLESTRSPLPLLQFTAAKLWERRDRKRRLLTRDSYERLGGVAGALSAHADAVLSALPLREQRLVRAVLLRLVTPERTRAVVGIDELHDLARGGEGDGAEAVAQVVQHLSGARLLLIGASGETGGDSGGTTVELVHESLIERWPKLGQWLAESEQDAQLLARLRVAAQQWEASGEAEGLLWRDRAAEDARAWYERRRAEHGDAFRVGLSKREERYLLAVVAVSERARRVRRRFVMGAITTLGMIAFVMSNLAIDADQEAARADQEAARAQAEAREARNATRMATARELQANPTDVLAILREIEPPDVPRGWADLARWALHSQIARAVLSHPEWVLHAVYSPDGERIVTSCADGNAWVWNAEGTGEPVVLRGHQDWVSSAAFSRDGKRIVTASYDKTARVWNAEGTGEPVVLRGHEDRVSSAAFSPDGKRIVTASWDKTARVQNADGSGEPVVLRGHEDRVSSVAFSPDGKRIVTASWDKTARVQNADGTGEILVLRGHQDRVYSAAFSPDGKRIVTASWDKTARVWNADGSGEPVILRGRQDRVYSAAFSPDGERVVTVSYDKTARVWKADGAGKPMILRGHEDGVCSAAFSPDGERIVTASYDKTARVWNNEGTSEPLMLRGHEDQVYSVAFSPDGERIVTGSTDRTARVWNADGTGEPVVFRGHQDRVYSAAFSPDGKRVVTGSQDRTARVWNADGSGRPMVLRGHDDGVTYVAFSPDGKRIVTASSDTTARVWNADGSGELTVLRGHEDQVYSAMFSPDGNRIVTASWDTTARVWNADGSGEPVMLRGHESRIRRAAFSPDGERIVTASYDKTARVWNADGSGEPVMLRGHEHWVLAARFSPDGKRIVTGSQDRTARVWNADGTREPMILQGSDAGVNDAAFSPDGKRIVTASDDKLARVWTDLDPLRSVDDPKLWTATTYCMPVERRIDLFRVPEAMARADRQSCLRRVEEARAAFREQR
ncbi:nSTAND1 domain-containing NTPase [Sorangium sp. So ce233]|uniref:nSTAND1 domain-containing NTPase n=1 Tax=Sorangium sp. So ce233 TaxID=3133290 RepID=UPI003F5F00DE